MPENISTHPKIAGGVSLSPSNSTQPNAQNTDSDENIIAAAAGSAFFCPTTCNVYATPEDITPVYRIGTVDKASASTEKADASKTRANKVLIKDTVKNCTDEYIIGFTLSTNLSITIICNAQNIAPINNSISPNSSTGVPTMLTK